MNTKCSVKAILPRLASSLNSVIHFPLRLWKLFSWKNISVSRFLRLILLTLVLNSLIFQIYNPRPAYAYTDCTDPNAYGYNQGSSFFSGVLGYMGISVSQFALDAFTHWIPYENTKACWNPLATTLAANQIGDANCTSTDFNGAPVRNYSSMTCGEEATAVALLYTPNGTGTYYQPIRDMLSQQSFNWQAIHDALIHWVGSDTYSTSLANEWQTLWNNRGGGTALTVSWSSPSNGQTINSRTVNLQANPSGGSGGINHVSFSAKYGGSWYGVQDVYSSPWAYNWDMCNASVPDGDIELGLIAVDNGGNQYVYSQHYANYHITKSYNCNPIPAAPSNLRVTSATQTSIAFAWDNNANNQNGFNIYKWNGSAWVNIGSTGSTSYTDSTGLTCNNTYYYDVSAYNGSGESSWANPYLTAQTSACTVALTVSWSSPSNGQTINSRTVNLQANPSGGSGGINHVSFSAKYGGNWHGVQDVYSSPWAYNWDMCNASVPDGDIELGLIAVDNGGNQYVYSQHYTNYHITKSYNCNPGSPDPRQEGPVSISGSLQVGGRAYFTVNIKNYGTVATPAIHPYIEGYANSSQFWRADGSQPGSAVIQPGQTVAFQDYQDLGVAGTWTANGIYLWNNDAGTYWEPLPANGQNQQFSFTVTNPPSCYTLSTTVSPGGSGTVNANPGLNCGSQYAAGTNVQLTANANSGYSFSNWSGDASGSSNPATVTMNGNLNVTANFNSNNSNNVTVTSAWTADGNGNSKISFNAGDSIYYTGNISNSTGITQTAYFVWSVNGPCGSIASWLGNLDTGSGTLTWWLPSTVPSTACPGTYTFQLSVTFNGSTTSDSAAFAISNPGFAFQIYLPFISDGQGSSQLSPLRHRVPMLTPTPKPIPKSKPDGK